MDHVTQHFRKEEAPIIDRLNTAIAQAASEYRPVLTEFLDPRERFIATTLMGTHDDVRLHSFGGYPDAERRRVIFAPTYFTPGDDDFAIAAVAIHYPEKFAALGHSQVLGTLANSGVARATFGDIVSDGHVWQTLVVANMVDWLMANVTRIGKISVRLESIDLATVVRPETDWESVEVSMTSVRLDSLISHAYHLSRARAKALVEADKVRLNFALVTAPDLAVGVADIVSVRGFGRIRIQDVLGVTKKGKTRLALDVIHK